MTSFNFPKSQRLTNKKNFEKLFEAGQTINAFPFKLIYITEAAIENMPPYQIAFTVPKRSFKKAVDRNLLKRRMRELFRLNKHAFIEHIDLQEKNFYGIIIYTNREIMTYGEMEKSWKKLISKFNTALTSHT